MAGKRPSLFCIVTKSEDLSSYKEAIKADDSDK